MDALDAVVCVSDGGANRGEDLHVSHEALLKRLRGLDLEDVVEDQGLRRQILHDRRLTLRLESGAVVVNREGQGGSYGSDTTCKVSVLRSIRNGRNHRGIRSPPIHPRASSSSMAAAVLFSEPWGG
jgi:hypothetical protein